MKGLKLIAKKSVIITRICLDKRIAFGSTRGHVVSWL